MGLIDIIKPLSIALSSAVIKSQQYQEKRIESIPGLVGARQERYLLWYATPQSLSLLCEWDDTKQILETYL